MFQRICGLQKPKLAAFILAAGLWGSYRYVVKEVTTCNHGSCLRRYDTLVCTHPLVYASTPLLSWMHWNVLYHTLFLLQSDGLTSPGANAERLLLELCALTESDRAWELFLQSRFKVYHYHSRNKRGHSEHTFRWGTEKRCLNDCPQCRRASPLSRRVFCVSNVLLDTRMDGERRRCQ